MNFASDEQRLAEVAAPISTPEKKAGILSNIVTYVLFGLIGPLVRGMRTPEIRETLNTMDDTTLSMLNIARADVENV